MGGFFNPGPQGYRGQGPTGPAPSLSEALQLGEPAQPQQWPTALWALLLLGVFCTGIANLAFVYLVKSQGPLYAGMVTYVIPLVALAWGQFDSERLSPLQIAAMTGVLSMVALVQWGTASPAECPTEYVT